MRSVISSTLALYLFIVGNFASAEEQQSQEKEKPKEPPFKCSAWCAFHDLNQRFVAPRVDPATNEETLPGSQKWMGFGRRGMWARLVLELKNNTDDQKYAGSATIHLNPAGTGDAGQAFYSTTYHQVFQLAPQTIKQYGFSVLCPEDGWSEGVQIDVVANGRQYERRVELHDLDQYTEELIVVVSESAGAFRHLATNLKPKDFDENIDNDDKKALRRVAIVSPKEMPTRWHDLTLASLIIIDGPPNEKLPDDQWEALKCYVQAGGQVLITAGKDPSRLKGPIEELAGMTVRAMSESSSLDEIKPPFEALREGLKLPLLEVTAPARADLAVTRNKKSGLVEMVQRSYGAGRVTFLPFSLNDKLLERWEGRRAIPLSLLSHPRHLFASDNIPAFDNVTQQQPWDNPAERQRNAGWLASLRQTLDDSFSNDTPVEVQKPEIVLSFLLFYLLCAVPGNYLLFGWFKRREIAWLAVPLWAAGFSVIAYNVGYMGQTGRLTVSEISAIECGAGQSSGTARTFLGLYAPQRNEYHLEFPPANVQQDAPFDFQGAPGHLINREMLASRNIELPRVDLLEGDQGLSLSRFAVKTRSTQRFEIQHRAWLNQGLTLRVRQPNPDSKETVEIDALNNTSQELLFPALILDKRGLSLSTAGSAGTMAPGQRFQATTSEWKDANEIFLGRIPSFKSVRGKYADDRARALLDYLREHSGRYPAGFFTAWIEGGALPVKVGAVGEAGEEPGKFEGLTLLIVPVPH